MVYTVSEILFIQTCNPPKQGDTQIWRQFFTMFLPLNFAGNVENTSRNDFKVLKVIVTLTGESQFIHFSPLITKLTTDQ